MRTRDQMGTHQLADALRRLGAGLHRRAHAADIALDDDRDQAAADLNLAISFGWTFAL